ncbi:MAG: alpha-amylase family glycosyl hydrolase [Xanthomonadales bacterium]|nr:alpha-amylase family glycosyl hydrolase [Xanthomonadales bacterium]
MRNALACSKLLRCSIAPVFAALVLGCTATAPRPLAPVAEATRHTDWRDQVIYFAMIDRFADGDPSNNAQGLGEYDPAQPSRYSGGDLAGITQQLDYIRRLGATALWITPPVRHQWWDPATRYGGYHGYWTVHFMQVDPHFGDLATYRELARQLHARDMRLVQDIVVNHVGNWFRYPGPHDPADPTRGYTPNPDLQGGRGPSQPPFDQNDPRNRAHRAAGIYHWNPTIRDATDRRQELSWQLADLDDLATGNPAVQRALCESYQYWIREVGVDAYRVDTAFYVEPEFFRDFVHGGPNCPGGMLGAARESGAPDFHLFGEGFGIDRPGEDRYARKIESYAQAADGTPLLPGMINFPLYGTLLDVYARGRPTTDLGHRIRNMMRVHARPHRMPTFVDNHDVDRFLASGSEAALQQALLSIFTLPGIPTIYYGTEQGYTRVRDAMFAAGHGSGGRDRYDTSAPLYRLISELAALRRAHRVLSRGVPRVLAESAAGPGVIAWLMEPGEVADAGIETLLVLMNTADAPRLLDALPLPAGARLTPRFAFDGATATPTALGSTGLTRVLPPRSASVWRVDVGADSDRPKEPSLELSIAPLATGVVTGDLDLSGSADPALGPLQLVLDGALEQATPVRLDGNGRWSATLPTTSLIDPTVLHRLVLWAPQVRVPSAPIEFRVQRQWTEQLTVDDPIGDDHGPSGRYQYPEDPGWGYAHQPDLTGARVEVSGGALRLTVGLRKLTTTWNPANGFDHVALTVFLDLPGLAGGSEIAPLQNTTMPAGLRWDRRLRVHGWSNALFSADGADARTEGRPLSPGATVSVDAAAQTITLTFPAAALGNLPDLSGTKIWINSWDFDGGYRSLEPGPGARAFRGGDGKVDPLWLDEIPVLVLP